VEDGDRVSVVEDGEVELGFGGGATVAGEDVAVLVKFNQVSGGDLSFVYAAGGHEELPGVTVLEQAEVATSAGCPAVLVEGLDGLAKGDAGVGGLMHCCG